MGMTSRQDWATPQWLFEHLNERFGPFTVDAAATEDNALCQEFFGDGLRADWGPHRVFCNPPWRLARAWAMKAMTESAKGCPLSVLVLPSSVNSTWFHGFVMGRARVMFPDRRVAYTDPTGQKRAAPDRDTMIAVYGVKPGFDSLPVRHLVAGVKR